MVTLERARRLGRAGGLVILIGSIVLFAYAAATGLASRHMLTIGWFIMFAGDGVVIAFASSRHGIGGPEKAEEKASLVGYRVTDEIRKKYAESASRLLLLWLVLLPTRSAFFMLYTYFILEPTGVFFDAFRYALIVWTVPLFCIVLFGYIYCFYMRRSELRRFVRSYWKGAHMRAR